ncbi:hypothetical protein [Actinacidiphila reveromycinica]|uniref:hypothetical protein n=1 Tax=Actinacidiphila reveromycinica TaxID=659352 RepID=UPI001922128F|nr:hypothetical protein [Streptomyces sp. SN-593]
MADVMLALAAETVVGGSLTATGVLLAARAEQVAGSAREGAVWLTAHVSACPRPSTDTARTLLLAVLTTVLRAHGKHRAGVAA